MKKEIKALGASCAKCGGKLLPNAKFCHHCGGIVMLERLLKRASPRRAGRTNAHWKIVAGVFVSAAVALGMLYLIHSSSQSSQSQFILTNVQVPLDADEGQTATATSTTNITVEMTPQTISYTDGEITNVQIPSIIEEGRTIPISITVRNTGNTSGAFTVKMSSLDSGASEEIYLSSSGSKTVTFNLAPSRGDSEISLHLYYGERQLDTWTMSITVLYIDGEITSYDIPSTAVEGEGIQIPVTIKNTGNKGAYFQVRLSPSYSSMVSKRVWLAGGSPRTITLNIRLDRNDSSIDLSLTHDGEIMDSSSKFVDVDYDEDGDGLYHSQEIELGTDPNNIDTDNDGLSDYLEVVTLSTYGANPLRRDIFVEIDVMEGTGYLDEGEINDLVNIFNDAPLENPDGSWGVDLHLYYDDVVPAKSINVDSREYSQYQRIYHDFPDGFRWALFVPGIEEGEWWEFWKVYAGFAWGEGFVVDTGWGFNLLGTIDSTFMHELGHSLGLMPSVYGGIDGFEWPWEYDSVMNYTWVNIYPWKLGYSSGGNFNDWEYLGRGFTNYWD